MVCFSRLGIGLTLLFGFLLLALVSELYYLLWWKKRRDDIENQNSSSFSNYTPTHLSSCFKSPNSSTIPETQQKDLQNSSDESDNQGKQQEPNQKESPLKGFGEESLDVELMRLHNLCGPPRFLFTINEETSLDLESEGRKNSRTVSLSELLCTPDTPNSSSPLKNASQAPNLEGFMNPLYDFDTKDFDYNRIRSSPPPTFKFLRDAEEKLLKKLLQLEAEKTTNLDMNQDAEKEKEKTKEKDGSFVIMGGSKGKSVGGIHHQMSTHSQVLPLVSSPSQREFDI
ncbi:hypothetical protein LXL04_036447 [Taraxacum kok-saghyz]